MSLNSIHHKGSVRDMRPESSHGSLTRMTSPILNANQKKDEKTVRLEETDDSHFITPKPITKLSKTEIIFDNSKLKKLSTTDELEELLSSQKSILDGIVDKLNNYGKDKHTDPCVTKVKGDK